MNGCHNKFVSSCGEGTMPHLPCKACSAAGLGLEEEPILSCPVFPVSVRTLRPLFPPKAKPRFYTWCNASPRPLAGFCTFNQPTCSTWVTSSSLCPPLEFDVSHSHIILYMHTPPVISCHVDAVKQAHLPRVAQTATRMQMTAGAFVWSLLDPRCLCQCLKHSATR